MPSHDKLFIPGPVEVSEKTWAAFSLPMIGHRGEDFKNLYLAIHPGLQTLFDTKQPVFLSTSSAWGVMEASIRNLVDRGVLCCMCGAFSDKWFDVAKRCGKNAKPLQVEWGKHIDQKDLDRQLATGKFDTVTLTHSETSTGVMNPLPEICCVLAKYPEVALIVDTVSSFSAVKIDMDALGIDVMLTGAQKALALPPGFSLFSVSEKAFERADKVPSRGFYFDFLEFRKEQAQWMTPGRTGWQPVVAGNPAGNTFSRSVLQSRDSFPSRQAAETNRLAACAPRIYSMCDFAHAAWPRSFIDGYAGN